VVACCVPELWIVFTRSCANIISPLVPGTMCVGEVLVLRSCLATCLG
jgi:hypothetical protein